MGFVIDLGALIAERVRAALRASAFTVRARPHNHGPLAIANGTTRQNRRSTVENRREERRCFIRSRGSQRHQIQ
jgi:hypothetical protein